MEEKRMRKTTYNVEPQNKKWFRWNTVDDDGYFNWPHDCFHLVSCYTWWEFEHNFRSAEWKKRFFVLVSTWQVKRGEKYFLFFIVKIHSNVFSNFKTEKLSCRHSQERLRTQAKKGQLKAVLWSLNSVVCCSVSNCWWLRKRFFVPFVRN